MLTMLEVALALEVSTIEAVMQIITVATIKGGVGKTIIASHLAAALAETGKETLLVDLDPQGHATLLCGVDAAPNALCVGDALLPGKFQLMREIVVRDVRPNLSVAPAVLRMAMLERQLYASALRHRALLNALNFYANDYLPDYVVIDTPPHIGAFTEAALHVADLTLAPIPALAGSMQGLADLRCAWSEMQDGKGGSLQPIVNMLDGRTKSTNAAVFDSIPPEAMRTRIPRAEPINQAALNHQLLFDASPKHPACDVFRALAKEIQCQQ